MISAQLKHLKDLRKLTNQQVSDLSGVPIGTINRIMSGQTDNPSFQTVCDIVMAMDGSLDELVGIKEAASVSQEKKLANNELIHLYESMLENKERWLHRLFVCCCCLIVVLVSIVAFDLLNPTIGFFQR